ncbi:MAG TPA: pitrilysin family protein [Vicinamibacterales bacterium]|nr:pitrilysin family protein [Vicinamibacterales bacterium]
MQIPYTKTTLANGLDVIVHEDHQLPMVAVNLWYHVGSKNERPGRTGFAHLFEHLMFEGSAHHDSGYFEPLQRAGGLINGSTNTDRTNYWEVVPTGAIDLALWMESDRMGHLLPALTDEKFSNQRDVVLNERRQNYENRPYGLAGVALAAALFPPEHPYHWITIGDPEDLRAASLADVKTFFETYYHPGNASLTLAGDIETGRALELADRYFGDIPRGPQPPPVTTAAPAIASQSLLLEDRVELPRLYLSWHSPAMFAADDAELDLAADVLAHGKTSRLYRQLVYERRLATDVSSYQHSRELSGLFQVACTAAAGVSLPTLEQAVTEAIQGLGDAGPTAVELARAEAQTEAQFVYRLQTVGGFGGKSDQLNAYNVFKSNPGFFDADLERYQSVTGAGMAAAVRRWLVGQPRVALSLVPRGRRDLALADATEVQVS